MRPDPFDRLNPYALGLAGVAVATAVRLPFEAWLDGHAPYALYYLPILLVAWRGGVGPTVLTTAASIVSAWFFVLGGPGSSGLSAHGRAPSLLLFVVVSLAIAALSHRAAALRNRARDAEEQCRRAERGAGAATWDWNPVDDVFEGPSVSSIFGLPEGAAISGRRLETLIVPEDRPAWREGLRRAATSLQPVRMEFRIKDSLGTPRWLSTIGQASSRSGSSGLVSGITLDITERKEAERATAEQREWFEVSLGSIGDAVIATDRDARVTFMNAPAEELTGWPLSDARGRPLGEVFRIINERTREPVENPVDKVIRAGVVVGLANHTALISRTGHERPIADSAAPIHREGGAVIGVILVFHDVTDERRAAREIADQREWFARTLESIGDAVIATDERGRIAFMNPVAEYLTGWRLADARDRDCTDVFRIVNESTRAAVESPVARVLREGNVVGLANHTVLISASGIERPIDDSGAPIRSSEDRIVGVVLVFRDVSERRSAELEKQTALFERERLLDSERNARSEAERANRLKDDFVATVSHELRTPLNAVLGWVRVLQREPDAETVARGLDVIARNTQMQAELISDLLDISRVLSGKLQLDFKPVDLRAVIEAAVDTVRADADAKSLTIDLAIEAAPLLAADPVRLQQVVWNLLSNAVKFTPAQGRITVGVRVDGYAVEIAVSDTGIGIRPEFIAHVFDRFRQHDPSTARQFGGLGLGLSIVKHLVELHGGSIVAESEGVDRGSLFRVRLPVGVPAAARPAKEGSWLTCESGGRPLLEGVVVMVVEDQPDTRELLVRVLEECKATVRALPTALDALDALARGTPDILLCDIGLPGLDGYALIERIRRSPDPALARVPAVALTAFARPEDRTRALLAGYQAHLTKPVDIDQVIVTVASLTTLARGES